MKDNKKKIFIEALEQRIMLDGAGASTALDFIDERNKEQLLNKNQKISKLSENKIEDNSQKLPFDQMARDQKRNDRKQVVFIDSQVQDYQTLIDAFNEDTEVYLIRSNEDGFKKIDKVLKNDADISSLHIIGHGSAGKILFGNATLSNDTIKSYNHTLRSIGKSLTDDGDILFYGCNVASTESGKILINKISEITKADIAASDDVTGKSGDWKLEIKVGHIDTKNINHTDYQHDLAMYRTASADTHAATVTVGVDGITSIRGAMAAFTGTADRNAYDFKSSRDHNPNNSNEWQNYYMTYNSGTFGTGGKNHSDNVGRFTVVLEKTGITSGYIIARKPDNEFANDKTESQWDSNSGYSTRTFITDTNFHNYELKATRSDSDPDEGPMDVYMVALDAHFGSNSDRYNKIAEVKFDREIIGILKNDNQTMKLSSNTGNIDMHNPNNNTYPTSNANDNRSFEDIYWRVFKENYNDNVDWGYGDFKGGDWIAVGGTDNRVLHVGAKNTGGGDYVRVLVKGEVASASAAANTATVNENDTITVTDGETAQNQTYEVNDAIDSSTSLTVGDDTHGSGISFSHDGKKMFKTDYQIDKIHQWTLSTAFDPTSISGSPTSANLDFDTGDSLGSGAGDWPVGHAWNSDGTKLFVVNWDGVDEYWIHSYDLSTAYDVSTISLVSPSASNSYNTGLDDVKSLAVSSDGTKFYFLEDDAREVRQITFATAYDVTSSASSATLSISDTTYPRSLALSDNGKKLFVGDTSGERIYQYNLTTAWDVSSGVSLDGYITLTTTIDPFGIVFTDGGLKMLVLDEAGETVDVHSLKSPFNLIDIDDEHDGDVLLDDTGSSLTVTQIAVTGSSNSAVSSGSSYNSSGTSKTGTYGTLTIGADGSYTYVADLAAAEALDAGDIVTDSFTYTVSDGSNTDTATLIITVIGVNDTPVADAETNSVDAGQTLTVTDSTDDVLHGDTDADASASLSVSSVVATTASGSATTVNPGTAYNSGYTSVTGSYGTLRIGSDGTYQYIANSSAGTDVFTYTVFDGSATHTATLTITVNSTNNAPTALDSTVYINENNQVSSAGDRTPSNITKIFAASDFNFSDSDGDSLSKIKITTLESAGALEYYNGSSWTDVTLNQEITAADIGNNYLRFTPAANSESDVTFSFKVHDGTEYSSSAYTMTISVNAAPNVTDTTVGSTVSAGGTSSGDVHDGVADSDDADSVLVVTGVASGNESSNNTIVTNGTGVGSSVSGTYGSLNIAANGTYTYTANATNNIAFGATATDTFTFTTRDDETNAGSFGYDVGTLTFTVASSISLVNDTDAVVEDGTVTHLTNSAGTVISDDTADSDGLVVTNISHTNGNSDTIESGSTYTDSGGEPGIVVGTYGTLTIGADGTYTYTADQSAADALDAGDVVTDVFTYTADGATATLTITVTGRNDEPAAVDDTDSVVEGATEIVTSGSDLLMADDTDADASSSLTVTQIAVTGGSDSAVAGGSSYNSSGTTIVGTYGTLIVGADGTYSYAADQTAANALDTGDSVTDSFTYTISDGTNTDTATLIITVTGVNDTPTAGNETVYINENNTDATHGARTSLNIRKDFAASDFTNYTDPDDDVGIKIKSLPTSGTLTKINNGAQPSVNDTITNITNLRYTPNANSESDDSFTYRAWDGEAVQEVTYTITISVNAAPVAVNDTGSITAGDDDATGNVLTNDTDSDDASSALGIRGVGAGAEGSTLANSNVGSAVSGTYGNLTIGSAGAYTYSVTGNAATIALRAGETATDVFSYKVMDDETNAGSKAIDIGTITFTITGIDGDATDEPNPDEVKKPKKEKKEEKRQKREEDRQLKKLKREKRLERKELKIPKSILAKNAEFNQGLKLVDLVAESNSVELKDKDMDIYVDKIIAKHSDKALKVKFKVFNDEGKEVQKYYGEMKDGSALPDWIKIDPKTGKTKTDIPKGMKMVEFKIIAVDVDNNKKQVTVIIDSKKIAEDKEILKQSRKIERAKKIEVKDDGSVKLNSVNEAGKINKTKTEVLNEIDSVEELVKTIEPDEFLNFEAKVENENFEVELPWQNLKVVLNNGQELPEWIKYDPKTGKVTASPPENVKSVDLKVIIENPNGELSVKDIKLDFANENAQETKNNIENETKFVSLSSQLSKEYSDWDNYGSQLIDRL